MFRSLDTSNFKLLDNCVLEVKSVLAKSNLYQNNVEKSFPSVLNKVVIDLL